MTLPLTEFLLSPYISIHSSESAPDKYKLTNSLTGRAFELGEKVIVLLRMFRSANTFTAIFPQSGVREDELEKLAVFFIENRLLLPADNSATYAMALSKTVTKVFGVTNDPGTSTLRKTIDLIGVPFGKGNDKGYGTEEFPDALRSKTAHLQFNPESMRHISFAFLDSKMDFEPLVRHFCDGTVRDLGNIFFHFNETVDYCYSKIEAIARSRFATPSIPVFIGGDHSITYPIVKAAAQQYPSIRILHFDAHLDTYYSKYDELRHTGKISHNHSNFMQRCLELDKVERVYHFGIRGLSNRFLPAGEKQRICWMEDLRALLQSAAWPAYWAELSASPDDSYYYITLDIDVLDPAVAAGTATPMANGMQLQELTALLRLLLPGKRIIGVDLVELDPSLDHRGLTMQCAISLLLDLINLL